MPRGPGHGCSGRLRAGLIGSQAAYRRRIVGWGSYGEIDPSGVISVRIMLIIPGPDLDGMRSDIRCRGSPGPGWILRPAGLGQAIKQE